MVWTGPLRRHETQIQDEADQRAAAKPDNQIEEIQQKIAIMKETIRGDARRDGIMGSPCCTGLDLFR